MRTSSWVRSKRRSGPKVHINQINYFLGVEIMKKKLYHFEGYSTIPLFLAVFKLPERASKSLTVALKRTPNFTVGFFSAIKKKYIKKIKS